jgi:SAM-dependent methyltransferase
MEIFFLFANLCFALLIFFLTIAFITGAPFVPSTNESTSALIRLSKLRPGMNLYDLGSGDGRLLFEAAKKGANAYGIEINPFLVLYTKIRVLFSPYRKLITVHWGNFWNAPLMDSDVVCIYLLPWRMEKLEKLLLQKTKRGTIIVSNSFVFPHIKQIGQDKATHSFAFQT